jgi:hypothetical protein
MRYEVSSSQIAYFEKNKSITFEDFYSKESLEVLDKYPFGFDIWRQNNDVKKIVLNKNLGLVLHELLNTRPIRLLYDKICRDEIIDLKNSSFQGVIAYCVIGQDCIQIVSPEVATEVKEKSLLVVFGVLDSVFTFKENDPYSVSPRKLGYDYGDALSTDDYPLIFR